MLLCKNAYTSTVCTAWTKQMTTVSVAQSCFFFEQWMLLQKMSGILAWNKMEHLWILSWTQVDKLVWGQKHWYYHRDKSHRQKEMSWKCWGLQRKLIYTKGVCKLNAWENDNFRKEEKKKKQTPKTFADVPKVWEGVCFWVRNITKHVQLCQWNETKSVW